MDSNRDKKKSKDHVMLDGATHHVPAKNPQFVEVKTQYDNPEVQIYEGKIPQFDVGMITMPAQKKSIFVSQSV